MSAQFRELHDGVALWRPHPRLLTDFHNSWYEIWNHQNPHGAFTPSWWSGFLPILQRWIATRPCSYAVLTDRLPTLLRILAWPWSQACAPPRLG
jgi:hypothetical protein